MTDPEMIRETYERHEKALGGPGWRDEAIYETARELGLYYAEVEDVMMDYWSMLGAG